MCSIYVECPRALGQTHCPDLVVAKSSDVYCYVVCVIKSSSSAHSSVV